MSAHAVKMTSHVALLRGQRLKEHLQFLSQRYQWNSFGRSVEVGPKSVTKRDRRRVERQSLEIAQTPVRSYTAPKLPEVSAVQSTPVFATRSVNFLAALDRDDSDASEEEAEFDDDDVENELMESFNRLDVIEYVPAPKRPALALIDRNVASSVVVGGAKGVIKVATTPGPSGPICVKGFKKERCKLVVQLFTKYNDTVFGSQLPSDLVIKWNKRLLTTAGITKLRLSSQKRVAVVELSEKVVDDLDRLKNTLLHELCHAAAWIVDAERRPPHGKSFWKWAQKASLIDTITTCHSYIIHKPFKYRCGNSECGVEYNRFSKSIDLERQRCGACRSVIEYIGKVDIAGTPVAPKTAGGFAAFVQAHFAKAKSKLNTPRSKVARDGKAATHTEVMQTLSAWYKEDKKKAVNVDF